MVNQYEIYFVNLDPTKGAEVRKARPCVVISPNEINHKLKTVIIAPITSTIKTYPTRINIELQNRNGQIMVDQLRAIDKSRIMNRLEVLSSEKIAEVKNVIREMLVD